MSSSPLSVSTGQSCPKCALMSTCCLPPIQGVESVVPMTCEEAGLKELTHHSEATSWSLQRVE